MRKDMIDRLGGSSNKTVTIKKLEKEVPIGQSIKITPADHPLIEQKLIPRLLNKYVKCPSTFTIDDVEFKIV